MCPQDLPAQVYAAWRDFRLGDPDLERIPVRADADGHRNAALPVACRTIGGQSASTGLLSAIETLFIIPVVIVTFLLQNQLLRGVHSAQSGSDGKRECRNQARKSHQAVRQWPRRVDKRTQVGPRVMCLLGPSGCGKTTCCA